MPDPQTQRIQDSLELERLDECLYRSRQLWKPANSRGAFGGNIIAQAARAATCSVDKQYHLHSLHCYFLLFGDADVPVIYHVDKLRDGKSYATRSVKAVQEGRSIFVLLASFQVPELSQPSYQLSLNMTNFPAPEACLPTEVKLQRMLTEHGKTMQPKMKEYLQREWEQRMASAIEIRNADRGAEGGEEGGKWASTVEDQASQTVWFRCKAHVSKNPAFQKLVLAYASDFRFIGTIGKALGLGARTEPKLAMMASLDHSMFFYENDLDVTQWMLYTMQCPRARDGRGVVIGRIYSRHGKLLVVCTQEGVARAELQNESKL